MPDTAFAKVEDAVKAVLVAETGTGEVLDGFVIIVDQPADEAVEDEKAVVIYTVNATPQQSDEHGQTFWNQTLEIAVIDGPQAPGSIGRAVQNTIANIHALLAADRSLGGRLQDLQEIDIAGTQAEGRDVHGASVQYRAEFYTARDDWFTLIGVGGTTF